MDNERAYKMKKLDLNKAADEFEIISSETSLFYNVKTGEFEWHNEYMDITGCNSLSRGRNY